MSDPGDQHAPSDPHIPSDAHAPDDGGHLGDGHDGGRESAGPAGSGRPRLRVRRWLARTVLRLARWRAVGEVPSEGVLVGAPHTSNWDFVIMLLVMWNGGVPPRVLMKSELFRGPLGGFLRWCGGIPIDRSRPTGLVRSLAAQARAHHEPFLVIIAAEGTRRKGDYWRSGFYRIAQETGLPIALAFVDGPTRTTGFGPTVHPTGDLAADMELVRAFYADKRGIRPANKTEPRLRDEPSAN